MERQESTERKGRCGGRDALIQGGWTLSVYRRGCRRPRKYPDAMAPRLLRHLRKYFARNFLLFFFFVHLLFFFSPASSTLPRPCSRAIGYA